MGGALAGASGKWAEQHGVDVSGDGRYARFRGVWVVADPVTGVIDKRWCPELRENAILAIIDAVDAADAFNASLTLDPPR